MKHFFKAVAVMVVILIVNIIINIVCNKNGIELNSTAVTFVSTLCALLLYHGLIKNEESKDDRK